MIKTISRTNDTILVVDDSGVKTARADHPKWSEICDLYNQITYVAPVDSGNGVFVGPTTELLNAMDMKTAVENYTVGLLSVNALGVTYNGRQLHTIDAERLMAFMRDKLSYKPIANYIARKMKNPSARAIKEMYNFLEHKGMPLTLRGTFIAYKGVSPDFWSIRGNKDTVVLQGQVNGSGQILNTIGSTIEVERSSVDDDFRQGCAAGLHVGSLAYARDWGKRVILVEVDPADVVSVPDDCSCQKLRCCKYTIVGEYSGPMPDTFTTEFDSTDDDEDDICHQCGNETDNCICDEDEDDAERNAECDGNCGDLDCPAKQRLNEAWLYEQTKSEKQREQDGMLPAPDACGCGHCNHQATINIPPPLAVKLDAPVNAPLNPDVYTRVVNIIAEQLGIDVARLTPDTRVNYDTLGMDSLDGVELCIAFEEEFQVEIPDEVVEKYIDCTVEQIVKDMTDYLTKNGKSLSYATAESNQYYDIGFADGKMQKSIDVGMNLHNPKYRIEDVDGSDSDAHASYIKGYVAAYNL